MINDDIRRIVSEQLYPIRKDRKVITDEGTMEYFGADSLDIVELMMAFEEEFEIEVTDEEGEKFMHMTVPQLVEYVEGKRK